MNEPTPQPPPAGEPAASAVLSVPQKLTVEVVVRNEDRAEPQPKTFPLLKILEVLAIPLSVALLGYYGNLAATNIKEENVREATEIARIAALTELASETFGKSEPHIFASAIAGYGPSAVHILVAYILDPSSDRTRRNAELGLITLADDSTVTDFIVKSMLNVLHSRSGQYDDEVHASALNVLAGIPNERVVELNAQREYLPRQTLLDGKNESSATIEALEKSFAEILVIGTAN